MTRRSTFMGRHPQTFTNPEVAALPRYFCFAPMNGQRATQWPSPFGAKGLWCP